MKKQLFLLTLLLIGVASASAKNQTKEYIKPSNNYITRTYKMENFQKLTVTTVSNVYYTQSTDGKYSVEAYGPDNIIELLQLTIKNGELTIQMEKQREVKNLKDMKITISSPNLSALNFKGVGNVYIENGLETPELAINYTGVGNMKLKGLNCETLTVSATGVGNIELSGNAQKATLSSDGVGDIEAYDLICKELSASVGGVGSITCYATETIVAKARGVGSISYKGNPANKQLTKGGIGSIHQK